MAETFMKHFGNIFWSMKALVLLAFAGSLVIGQPSTVAETELLIEKIKQEIAEVEKQWAEEKQRAKEAEADRQQRYSQFREEKQRLEQDVVKQENAIAQTHSQIEALQRREKDYQARYAKYLDASLEQVEDFKALVEAGFPYRLEKRKGQARLLQEDAAAGRIEAEETVNRLWVQYKTEHGLASDAELYTGDAPLDGGAPVQASFLRVGKKVLAYMSKDQSSMGFLSHNQSAGSYEWIREEQLTFDQRQAIRHAFNVAEKSAPPGFVPFPATMSSFKQSVESGEEK